MSHADHSSESGLVIIDTIKYLLRSWLWIVVAAILGGVIAYIICKTRPALYQAQERFFINSDDSPMSGELQSVLGAVGLDYSDEEQKIEKIKIIARSETLLRELLMSKIDARGKIDYLGNHIIAMYDLEAEWQRMLSRIPTSRLRGDAAQDAALLSMLVRALKRDEIAHLSSEFLHDLKSGLMTVRIRSVDEDLSLEMSRGIYDRLSTFYTDKVLEKPTQTLSTLRSVQDSIRGALASAEARLASYDSRNRNVWSPTDTYKRDQLSREVMISSTALGSVTENVQLAQFILQNTTPYFQVVDSSSRPLEIIKPWWVKWVPIGAFLGGFLCVIALLLRLWYRSVVG